MPIRFLPFATGQFYHVYNRGVARQPVFLTKRDYDRFLLTISYYRFTKLPFKLSHLLQLKEKDREYVLTHEINTKEKLVEHVAFVLMPNHFHLLLKQDANSGISVFLSKTLNSYTKYFNTKRKRVGPLFQGAFKAVRIESDEQLLHLSRYIHLNPLVSYVVRERDFLSYPWSSLRTYLGKEERLFIEKNIILQHFSSPNAYLQFVMDQADYGKKLEEIKHVCLETNP